MVAETLDLSGENTVGDATNGLGDRLIRDALFQIDRVQTADFTAAFAPFRRHGELTFVDSTSVADTHREPIGYLHSVAHEFDAVEGLPRLATGTIPVA